MYNSSILCFEKNGYNYQMFNSDFDISKKKPISTFVLKH